MASNPSTLFVSSWLLLLLSSPQTFHHTCATAFAPPKPHFVLVHGLGHGAWCWYQVITQLEAASNLVTAIDLTSAGRSKVVADTVTSIAHFTAPLINFLNGTSDRVILVGHSLGGSSISFAMELFPEKILKAIFLAAFMPLDGQLFLPHEALASVLEARVFIPNFAHGRSAPFTSVHLNLTAVHGFFYNGSPAEDVTLAYTSLDPQPGAPLLEILNLTSAKYGSVQRIYIKTTLDHAIPLSSQQDIISNNPPDRVFTLHSDHSPFFSRPVDLTSLLVFIASNQ